MLRTLELENKELNANDPWEPFLSAAAWAIRGTVNTTLDAMPGQLVFGQDMLLPIQLKTDWARIRQHKEDIINVNNKKENSKQIEHEYCVGEKVLLEKPGLISKLSAPRMGPYRITETYTKGTVRIQRGIVNEGINIHRIKNAYCPIREASAIHRIYLKCSTMQYTNTTSIQYYNTMAMYSSWIYR